MPPSQGPGAKIGHLVLQGCYSVELMIRNTKLGSKFESFRPGCSRQGSGVAVYSNVSADLIPRLHGPSAIATVHFLYIFFNLDGSQLL